uniref:Uncharacterized protein n=1 Tax=Romanomermis culicivorax TaxID=13658 RepID=A0A915I7M7_ROMCU
MDSFLWLAHFGHMIVKYCRPKSANEVYADVVKDIVKYAPKFAQNLPNLNTVSPLASIVKHEHHHHHHHHQHNGHSHNHDRHDHSEQVTLATNQMPSSQVSPDPRNAESSTNINVNTPTKNQEKPSSVQAQPAEPFEKLDQHAIKSTVGGIVSSKGDEHITMKTEDNLKSTESLSNMPISTSKRIKDLDHYATKSTVDGIVSSKGDERETVKTEENSKSSEPLSNMPIFANSPEIPKFEHVPESTVKHEHDHHQQKEHSYNHDGHDHIEQVTFVTNQMPSAQVSPTPRNAESSTNIDVNTPTKDPEKPKSFSNVPISASSPEILKFEKEPISIAKHENQQHKGQNRGEQIPLPTNQMSSAQVPSNSGNAESVANINVNGPTKSQEQSSDQVQLSKNIDEHATKSKVDEIVSSIGDEREIMITEENSKLSESLSNVPISVNSPEILKFENVPVSHDGNHVHSHVHHDDQSHAHHQEHSHIHHHQDHSHDASGHHHHHGPTFGDKVADAAKTTRTWAFWIKENLKPFVAGLKLALRPVHRLVPVEFQDFIGVRELIFTFLIASSFVYIFVQWTMRTFGGENKQNLVALCKFAELYDKFKVLELENEKLKKSNINSEKFDVEIKKEKSIW